MAERLNRVKQRKKWRSSKSRNLPRREKFPTRAKEQAQPDLEGGQTQGDELVARKKQTIWQDRVVN